MEQESKTEIEALREQVDQLTVLNSELVAVIHKLSADLNTTAQLTILARGRYRRGCRVCGQKPELNDPPIMDAERAFHANGHHFAPLSPDTRRALMSDAFGV